jgi:hypothetical protein
MKEGQILGRPEFKNIKNTHPHKKTTNIFLMYQQTKGSQLP